MQRRKFIKHTSFVSFGTSLFPMSLLGEMKAKSASQIVQFSAASTQFRHGALNIPFAKFLKEKWPFDWLIDVHQNIFLKNGFQRNEAEDMHVISIALKEEKKFEALQINIQAEKISFLWKDQIVSIETFETYHTIPIWDDKYNFSLLHLQVNEFFQFAQEARDEYYLQVLDGEVQLEEYILTTTSGLGSVSAAKSQLHLQSNKESRVLIIRHQL